MLPRVLLGLSLLPLLAIAWTSPAYSDSPPKLKYDPFRAREEAVVDRADRGRDRAEPVFRPILQSTIVGESGSLAMLGGVMLEVGEETNGYRLVEVRTFDALFEKNGERLRLEVVQEEGASR